jgi:hypothetical protein
MKKLVVFRDNWTDEFDISGFLILDLEAYDMYDQAARKYFEAGNEAEFYFGTNNEYVTYSSYEEWSRAFRVVLIEDDEAAVIHRLLGPEFGIEFFTSPFDCMNDEDGN